MKKSLFFGAAAILMSALASCSSDNVLEIVPSQPLDHDQTFFANIDIRSTETMNPMGPKGAPASRADYDPDNDGQTNADYTWDGKSDPQFEYGTDQENEVKTIYLIFYDENGNRVSTTQVRRENNNLITGEPEENAFNTGTSIYKGVVQIDVKHGQLPPSYVMCFINPITSQNFEINPSFATLEELQKTTRPKIIDDNGFFAMSKSVYYGVDRSRDDFNADMIGDSDYYEKIVATPIADGQLFTTVEKATDAVNDPSGDGVIDIYVERYAAKVNLSVKDAASEEIKMDDQDDNEIKLKFVPDYWAVNAYEEETYICKSFLGEGLLQDMSFKFMDDALGGDTQYGSWFWNNPEHHRCYWAQTPAYYKQEYPRVADDILDNRTEIDMKGGFALGYYSYQEMVDNAEGLINSKSRKITLNKQSHIYARENTVSGEALHKAFNDPMASPKAAVASAVIVGHYTIGDDNKTIDDKTTFYVMGNAVNGYTYFENDEKMVNWFVNTTIRFATNQRGNQTFYNYGIENFGFKDKEYAKYFKIAHPSKAVRTLNISNNAVIDSRFVTIQINEDNLFAEGAPTLYAELDGIYTAVTRENVTKVNQQMYYQAGTVQGFKGGKAYFTIPIKHLGFYRQGNENAGKMGTEKNFNWLETKSGDFGLVRNHVYTISVNRIAGLGNGIPDFDDPIVPPTDPEEYFIGARIIVLNWAVVPEQKVDLL